MAKFQRNNQLLRGFFQSTDGNILNITRSAKNTVRFQVGFGLSPVLKEKIKHHPQHFIFSERSRIARLGISITSEVVSPDHLDGDKVTLTMEASSAIPGYPGLDNFKEFFISGFPVGRLVYCDPEALLTSDEVLAAIERSDLKLPASTTISGDGSILISPHNLICKLKQPLDRDILGRILFREDGRALLNRYQVTEPVPSVIIPPGTGVITTCSMYLNEHYVVLQSEHNTDFEIGSHFPATILDPIKTRGIRIYLEIGNSSKHPIVNPLIPAKIYRAPKIKSRSYPAKQERRKSAISYDDMKILLKRFDNMAPSPCHYLSRPCSLVSGGAQDVKKGLLFLNGPQETCSVTKLVCEFARKDYSVKSKCPHIYATSKATLPKGKKGATLAVKYFPNSMEHHDIIDMANRGDIDTLYFFNPSYEHGPFLSQRDHNRLQEFHDFGLTIYWVSALKDCLLVYTIRDGMGYFVVPERLTDFHKSMLFAFYGSNKVLSPEGFERLKDLMDALVAFWGKNIGVVTGGGSGVMEHVNTLARERGMLSGANFLDITDQSMSTDVDFCQVFQSSCRHSRQKWFEIASFPIFNIGGMGSLEELGITLCNMKLSILDPVPLVLFDTEDNGYWRGMEQQIAEITKRGRGPAWIKENIVITSDPQEVIRAYAEKLHLF